MRNQELEMTEEECCGCEGCDHETGEDIHNFLDSLIPTDDQGDLLHPESTQYDLDKVFEYLLPRLDYSDVRRDEHERVINQLEHLKKVVTKEREEAERNRSRDLERALRDIKNALGSGYTVSFPRDIQNIIASIKYLRGTPGMSVENQILSLQKELAAAQGNFKIQREKVAELRDDLGLIGPVKESMEAELQEQQAIIAILEGEKETLRVAVAEAYNKSFMESELLEKAIEKSHTILNQAGFDFTEDEDYDGFDDRLGEFIEWFERDVIEEYKSYSELKERFDR